MTASETDLRARLAEHLEFLYPGRGAELLPAFVSLVENWRPPLAAVARPLTELSAADTVLICYGDQLTTPGEPPLATLGRFLQRFGGDFSAVHLLPFFPFSSDDGFSVIDYRTVRPDWGDWADIDRLGERFDLMLDAVVNHVSSRSRWFQGFLAGEQPYSGYFLTPDPAADLSTVVRPRTSPLLTAFDTVHGRRQVWTTFSGDQIDLDYGNPEVLLEMSEVLLDYALRGARFLRLDAVTYLWKQPGTPSVHLPQTHRVIQFWRTLFDLVAPWVVIITETNVPHAENISYVGDGQDEAQLVYNFALPPLVLHTFGTGDSTALSRWAAGLELPGTGTAFLNFLASHDGIGVRGVEDILRPDEVDALVARVQAHGGLVGQMTGPDGSNRVYELNANYYDALSDPGSGEPTSRAVARFLAAHAVMLALPGVPALYVHSLLGSRGDPDGAAASGQNRSINREKFDLATLEAELADPQGRRAQVVTGLRRLLRARADEPAFAPAVAGRVLDLGAGIFAIERSGPAGRVLCLQSVVDSPQSLRLPWPGTDLVTGRDVAGAVELDGYEVVWLKG